MKKHFRSAVKGYIYSLWNGDLMEYSGEALYTNTCANKHDRIYPRNTIFIILDEHGDEIKRLQCSRNEGEVYGKTVWLTESNKRKAADIFIKHEEEQITNLNLKIENSKALIRTLNTIESN